MKLRSGGKIADFTVRLCSCELGELVPGPALETVHQRRKKSTVDLERWDSGKSRSQVVSPSRLTFQISEEGWNKSSLLGACPGKD